MAYQKQEWEDYPLETTPISSERLLHIENGIEEASNNADKVDNAISNAYPTILSYPNSIIDNTIASWNLALNLLTIGSSSYEQSATIEMPTMRTLNQLKSVLDAKADYASSINRINLLRNTACDCVVSYIDGENTTIDYTVNSEIIPISCYYINTYDGYYLPFNISDADEPTDLVVYVGGYIHSYILGHDTSKAFLRTSSRGTVVNSWVTTNTGSGNTYVVGLINTGGSSYEFVVIGINYSTHTITQNNLVGIRYNSYNYAFYPMQLIYGNISDTIIDDTSSSIGTTYSSAKIDNMISRLQAEIEELSPFKWINVNAVSTSRDSDEYYYEISWYDTSNSYYHRYSCFPDYDDGAYIDATLDYTTYHGKKPVAIRVGTNEYDLTELGNTQYTDEEIFSMYYTDESTLDAVLIGYTSRLLTQSIDYSGQVYVYAVGILDDETNQTYKLRYVVLVPSDVSGPFVIEGYSTLALFNMSQYVPQTNVDFKFPKN